MGLASAALVKDPAKETGAISDVAPVSMPRYRPLASSQRELLPLSH